MVSKLRLLMVFLMLVLAHAVSAVEVQPQSYYGEIARRVVNMLPRHHVLKTPVNDAVSAQAWTNLISFYDYDRSVFTAEDLAVLEPVRLQLDDQLKAGDVSFGYSVRERFLRRLDERMDFATNLLAIGEFDFSVDERCGIKRKDAEWPQNRAEAEELWRLRLKNELLVQVISSELGRDGKENSTNRFVFSEELANACTNLVKRYRQYAMVMREPDEEQALQYYLSSVTRAYDPHTDYLSPMTKEDFETEMNLTLCGIGAVLQMDDGLLKISEIMPGGPLDRDGRIQEGDRIAGVQQGGGEMEDITWHPMKRSVSKIRGKKGTKVTLDIVPRGETIGGGHKLIELVRDEIKLEDQAATGRVEKVTLDGVEYRLGYVYLPSFYGTMDKHPNEEGFRSCAQDVARYLCEFNASNVSGAILDLRGNGGGALREAVMLSALFVQSGPVVQVREEGGIGALAIPYNNPVCFKRPLVVLIDRASASASEIVAAHLHDTGRAIVLGDSRTHGKGTVQTVMGIGPEKFGSMKITTARFYRINGASTQLEGVASDICLPSVLDSLDVGEDKLPNALPFTKVCPADYALCWNLYSFLPQLESNVVARLASNERYQKHIASVKGMREVADRTEVPLEYTARKAMMKHDRELNEHDTVAVIDGADESEPEVVPPSEKNSDDDTKPHRRRRRNQRSEDDVVLDSAFDVLADLVKLNGNRQLPRRKSWWE